MDMAASYAMVLAPFLVMLLKKNTYLFERARKRGREGKIDLLSAGSSWVPWMMEALGPTR